MCISRAANYDNVNAPDGFFQIGCNHIQLGKTIAGVAWYINASFFLDGKKVILKLGNLGQI